MESWSKPGFCVIGLEGSTAEGEGFVARLWEEANRRFPEVADLAVTDAEGRPVGVWGAMTDMGHRFLPWEDGFTKGLYLAGVECRKDAQPPQGWVRWDVPGFRYLRVRNDAPDVFPRTLARLADMGLSLVGAVQDFTDPASGQGYMCFPVAHLTDE